MKKKLTLTIDEDIKEQARKAARRRGVSISEMVERYLESVSKETDNWEPRSGSVVSRISGSIQHKDAGEAYSDIVTDALIEKYGYGKNSD